MVLSSALEFSSHLPVSVLVRIPDELPRGFSRRSVQQLRAKHSASLPGLRMRIYQHAALELTRTILSVRLRFLPRHPIGNNAHLVVQEY
jgi:hypothetical protein